MAQTPRHQQRRVSGFLMGCLLLAACDASSCLNPTPDAGPGAQCVLPRDCASNEDCIEGACVAKSTCRLDADCALEEKCNALTKACVLRPGFGTECGLQNGGAICPVGSFCALGSCRETATAQQCSRRFQCSVGQVCDRVSFYCIEEAPCTYAELADGGYPELACDPGDRCEPTARICVSTAVPECDPVAAVTGCAADEICSGAGQCVQCLGDQDCGPGLRCNTRAGLCESTNTCRSDAECRAPLVCDRTTAVCSVPLPPCTSDFNCQLGQFCDRQLGTCQLTEGKCEDDRFEDSDTPVAARVVDLSAGTLIVEDLQLCPNDADVFYAELAAGDGLRVTVVGATANSNTEITALGPDGLQTLRYAQAPPRGNGTVSFAAQTGGRYYIRVSSLGGKSAYQLEFTRSFVGTCMADAFEPESDSAFTARALNGVITGGLTLCPGDVDFYALPITTAGTSVAITLDGPAGEDFDLVLTDQFGVEHVASSQGRGPDEFIRFRFNAATASFISVVPYGASTGAYSLTVELFPPYMCLVDVFDVPSVAMPDAGDPPDAAVEPDAGLLPDAAVDLDAGELPDAAVDLDAGELDASGLPDAGPPPDAAVAVDAGPLVGNNTRESATPVSLDGLGEDLSICLGDEDWFAVEARSHQRVVVTATWPSGEAGVQLEGYAGTTLLQRATGFSVAVLSVPGNAAGLVYVRVMSPSAASPYRLEIDVERLIDCEPDSAEPNNTPAVATAAVSEGVFTLCGTDNDLFRLEVTAGKRVKATVEFSTADGDVDLGVLLPDGVTLLAISDGVTSTETVDVIIPADAPDGGNGAYFLTVFSARSDTKARYRLTSQVLAP